MSVVYASALMVVSHKPVSSTFSALVSSSHQTFQTSPSPAYQNRNPFVGVKKHFKSIKSKFAHGLLYPK